MTPHLELQSRLGYTFKDASLLELALTTPAFRMVHPDADDNQRLEFLGDAVFQILSAETLYAAYPWENEGALTMRRTRLASGVALAHAAEAIGIRSELRRNKGAAELAKNAKVLADAMEAVLGAIWLDGGIDAARKVYARLWPVANETPIEEWRINPKGYLQRISQSQKGHSKPVYEVLSVTGPSHAPEFTVRASVEGLGSAEAKAGNQRSAEAAAAAELIAAIKQHGKEIAL